jgi:hypothetical protein
MQRKTVGAARWKKIEPLMPKAPQLPDGAPGPAAGRIDSTPTKATIFRRIGCCGFCDRFQCRRNSGPVSGRSPGSA